jgi:hypothetical protein
MEGGKNLYAFHLAPSAIQRSRKSAVPCRVQWFKAYRSYGFEPTLWMVHGMGGEETENHRTGRLPIRLDDLCQPNCWLTVPANSHAKSFF